MTLSIDILIVEDNPDDFLLLKENIMMTEDFTAKIHHAERLQEGFAIIAEKSVDLAILDLDLPDSDGLATLSAFHKKHPTTPAVIYSGQKDHELALQAIKGGAQDYLFKGEPSQPAIIRIIRYAIERQRLTTELREALAKVEQLQGLLPICSHCKSIRDDDGYWNRVEHYISKYVDARFSHGICPDCAKKHYPEIFSDDWYGKDEKK